MVKRQQLFNSFWPSLTTLVVATQPAWADTVQVTEVRINPTVNGIEVILETPSNASPPVLTSSYGETFVANIINTQLRFPKGKTFRADNPIDGITGITVTPLNGKSIRVTVKGEAGVPVGQMVRTDKGLVLSLRATHTSLTQPQSPRPKSDQLQTISITSGQPSQDRVKLAQESNPGGGNGNSESAPSASPRTTSPITPSPTNSDLSTTQTPAPSYLNPSPNPLQFPTRSEEVQIQGTQPITFQQAFDLALRNNRTLQVEQLNLEASRAALREAQAAEFPRVTLGVDLVNQGEDVFSNQGVTTSTGTVGQTTGVGTGVTTGTVGQTTGVGTGVTTGAIDQTTGAVPGQTTTGAVDPTSGVVPGQTTTGAVDPTTGVVPGQTTGAVGQTTTTGTGVNTGTLRQSGGGFSTNSTNSTGLSGTLALSYDLYTSGQRRANIRRAEQQLRFDQLDVEREIEQLRVDVANDYYDLQAADESVRINQAAVRNAQASLRDAQALEQAGVGTRFDVLQSQVQLADETQRLTNSLSQQRISRRQLATRLSLAQSVNISAADPVEIAGLWNFSLEDSIVLAFQNRAELEQQLALRNISEQRRRIALSDLGPQVSLVASYRPSDAFNDDANFSDNYSVGANVSLNLFEGGAARARARQEEANIAIAEANFADTRNQIRFEVEQGYSELQANLANIQTASIGLEQAREALRLARLRFQAGVGTQTDVINAENALTEAEGNRVTAILDYNRSLATLQRAITSGQPR